MGKASRDKGARGEREVCAIFQTFGIDAHRVPNSGGLFIPGDIIGVEGLHIEVKRAERLSLPEWIRQAESECGENVPAVVYRSNGEPWRIVLRLDDYLRGR